MAGSGDRPVLSAATLLAVQPAAAGGRGLVGLDPGEPRRGRLPLHCARTAATAAAGTAPALVAVEGNFGPGKTWSQLNMASSGGNWTETHRPLEPGLYYYQY